MVPEDYDINDSKLFKRFCMERGLKRGTPKKYVDCLNRYVNFCDETLEFLIEEADIEEETIPRPAKRKIKERLVDFRVHLKEVGYGTNTIITTMSSVSTFYHHFDITTPKLPRFSYDESPNDEVEFRDLPTIDDIRTAIENTRSLRRKALFIFQACNGTSRADISNNFTFKQFKEGIQEYFPDVETPQDIIRVLDGKCDELMIMPVFRMKRTKTNYRYHTIITPEATQFCINYLKVHGMNLTDDDQFFTMKDHAVTSAYKAINNKMGWGKRGSYDFFSSHRVRKFNASAISDTDFVHYIQGRKPGNKMNEIYFKKGPEKIREIYEKYLSKFGIYARYDILINSEAYTQLLEEKNELEQQLTDAQNEITNLKASHNNINNELNDIRNQIDNVGIQNQMIELQKRAAQHPLAQETPGIMEYVMRIFKDKIDFNERSFYSDAEIDDMVRLALATKNKIEQYEDVLTEEKLQKQYPEHYDEATAIINKYKERYVEEDLGVPLSDLQNQNVDNALLPFKKQVLEDKKNPDYTDESISVLINPQEVQDIIDEALGLADSVEAIYEEGNGVSITKRFQ